MKLTFTEIKDDAEVILCIMRSDGWSIPIDPANSDYQAYLATLASELSNPSTPQAGE